MQTQEQKRITIGSIAATALILSSFWFPVIATGEEAAQPATNANTNTNTNTSTTQNTTGDTPATQEEKPPVDVSDLELKIREQKAKIEELERQQRIYEANVSLKRQESMSLKNQITILDNQISDTDVSIQKLELQIELLGDEIAALEV